jgi:hypothetical protein
LVLPFYLNHRLLEVYPPEQWHSDQKVIRGPSPEIQQTGPWRAALLFDGSPGFAVLLGFETAKREPFCDIVRKQTDETLKSICSRKVPFAFKRSVQKRTGERTTVDIQISGKDVKGQKMWIVRIESTVPLRL